MVKEEVQEEEASSVSPSARMFRRMGTPLGAGLGGLALALSGWFAFVLLALWIAGEPLQVQLQRVGEASGQPMPGTVALAAIGAVGATLVMAFGAWVFGSTGNACRSVWRVANGHPPDRRTDIRTAVGAACLLALWVALFPMANPLFGSWDAVLAAGTAASLWRLRRPARRAFFGEEARAELTAAGKAAKPLGFACLVVFAAMASSWHWAIASLPGAVSAMLAVCAAGVLVGLAIPVERHLRAALSKAVHERKVDRIRNRDR